MKGGPLMEVVPALQARSNTVPGPKRIRPFPKITPGEIFKTGAMWEGV